MEYETIATFHELQPAEGLRVRLEQRSITARVQDQRRMQKYWFISKPLAGVKLQVEKHQFGDARQLLQEPEAAVVVTSEAVHCPQCSSSRIEYPQFSRKSFIPNFILGLFMAGGFVQREFYCQECHYTWPTAEPLRPKTDILGWPEKPKAPPPTSRRATHRA